MTTNDPVLDPVLSWHNLMCHGLSYLTRYSDKIGLYIKVKTRPFDKSVVLNSNSRAADTAMSKASIRPLFILFIILRNYGILGVPFPWSLISSQYQVYIYIYSYIFLRYC